MEKFINCKFIDSDGREQFEKVFFVDSFITGTTSTRYRINGFIAQGGNGILFRCYRENDNKCFAVKLLRVISSIRRDRFDFEQLLLLDLSHTNVLHLCDNGTVEMTHRHPIPFIITDFFSTNIERRIREQGLFTIPEIKMYGKQICDAFDYLHANGVIHRDIKPGNFLIEGENIVVSDFGLAKTFTEDGATRYWRSDMTSTDERIGSMPWMSPELYLYTNNKNTPIDHRSDIFQVGKVLWFMHTGSFAGIPDIDKDQSSGILHSIVIKSIQENPEKRFPSAKEMSLALDKL
jgi:serine/threonine-protein kinase